MRSRVQEELSSQWFEPKLDYDANYGVESLDALNNILTSYSTWYRASSLVSDIACCILIRKTILIG